MRYDADGLGAGVRGDARVINDKRKAAKQQQKKVNQFRGSGAVHNPEKEMIKGRKNKDMFLNLKAQGWWSLRVRFQNTYRAVVEGMDYNADDLISISEDIPATERQILLNELSQPTYGFNDVGKMKINKAPGASKSPNAGDAVMIQYAPGVSTVTDYSRIL
jgi:phage terminase large subunit